MVRWVLPLLVLALGACTSVQGNLNGRVAVTVSGLPEGVSPRVVLQGNGMEKEVTGSAVLEVPEGDYVVTADSVTGPQGERYDPVVENAKFRVEYGKTVEVKVTYNLVTETLPASLTVLVQGLPSGVEASVTVYGPGGTSWTVKQTTVLRGLKAGTYSVSAGQVEVAGRVYTPKVDPVFVTLPGGGSGTVTVQYQPPDTGYLAVEISGLPSGVGASVEVRSSSAVVATLTESRVLELEVGTYLVVAREVSADGKVYRASVSGSPAEVKKGTTTRVAVSYAPVYTTGTLVVTISGLPSGVEGRVKVTGPNYIQNLTKTTSLEVLPGIYTVEAEDVVVSGGVYRAKVTGSPVQVQAGATSGVGVSYTLDPSTAPGDLLVKVNGLPSGAVGSVRVKGPNGFDRTIGQTTLFSALPAGYYTVEAGDVAYGGKTYRAVVTGSPARVSGEGTATVQVDYSLYSAFLTVQISGLPGPVANVIVTGPDGYNRTLNASAVLTVNPGTYAVSAYPVVVDGVTYTPQVQGSPVSLDSGGNGAVQVIYQQQAQ
ncbi:hypothetical protein CSW18_07895 [Thermus scotoductus]|uniref:Lipoprotein n=1 Tax=Thermus scotoductus TaxID=37636 RepID=A0A430RY56_THESC|nr:hypothetical protein [Thermus scotoductus]RTH25981.1 hypothetical protein CSW40_06105 [Thermus scotoductus]RTI13173.1 hypothetical protein CSW27_08930 [Thermus scotoductus]RTI38665.1 hypothetical protein CSW18_07895 [Thermus scotoductus]